MEAMKSEAALGSGNKVGERFRFILEKRLAGKGLLSPADVASFCEALSLFVHAGWEGGGEAGLEALEESACALFESGVTGHELAAALLDAAEHASAAREGGSAPHRDFLRAQVAIMRAMERAERMKLEEMERRLAEIDGFPETIAATLDPPTLARMGLERLKDIAGAREASLFRYEERGIYARNVNTPGVCPGERLVLEGRAEIVLTREKGAYLGGDAGPPGVLIDGKRADLPGRLFLPLVVRGRTTGLVMLERDPAEAVLGADALTLARRFADRMAVALENAGLHSREQRKIREMLALLELTRAINSTLDLEEILDRVARMSVDLCEVRECVVYLRDAGGGHYQPAARHGFLSGDGEEGPRFLRPGDLGEERLRRLEDGKHELVGVGEAEAMFPRHALFEHGVGKVLLHPLSSRERLNGILVLCYPASRDKGPERDELELIAAIAAQASMAIENASLYEDIEKSYYSTIRALARAIEVKDPYTHGHSERVTEYALIIAEAMRLDEREKQKLKYAATLHDIGKIGIAGRVLNKPGALTEEEYSHVKTHPLLGDSIIEPVEFLQEPRPIILHHHERYDGKGYPDGLKGEDIPLCARILSVADAFEAMRSDRPYRRALPLAEAVEELKRNGGTQFDPRVVRVFLTVLEAYGGDPVNR